MGEQQQLLNGQHPDFDGILMEFSWNFDGILKTRFSKKSLMDLNGFFDGILMGFWDINGIYPLVNVYITVDRSTMFSGKTRYFYGHVQWLC